MNPVETVNRLIAARKPGTLTLTQAAKACRLSPCRLSTLYRERTGVTAGQWRYRLEAGTTETRARWDASAANDAAIKALKGNHP